METAIFGGCSSAFNKAVGAGLSEAGIFRTDFPRQDCVGLETAGQPILNNEPNHWHEITSYPVPAIYFANVFRQEFWQLSVRGPNFLHMGPVTFAHVFSSTEAKSLPAGTKYKPKLRPFNHITDVDVDIKRPATEVEAKRIQIKKLRRDQCDRIYQAIKEFDSRTREETQLLLQLPTYAPSSSISCSHSTSVSASSSSEIGVHPAFVPPCHRFEIIRDYLFQHRQALALDALYFEIAEHILLHHVRNSGLELEADEWRGFLQICNEGLALFRWRPLGAPPARVQGMGMVTRINAGWPAYTPIPRQFPPKSSRNNKISLDTATERLVTAYCTFEPKGNLHDLDKDVFLQLTNKSLAALRKTERADMEDLNLYIAECENSGLRWCFGPEGTIRKMENGW